GSRGLQLVDGSRPLLPAQALHAFGDGTAGDEHDPSALLRQARQLAGPAGDGRAIQPAAVVGHQAGTDLDYQTVRLAQQRGHGAAFPAPASSSSCIESRWSMMA